MTTLVIGIVLIVAGVAFAAAPFLRRRPGPGDSGGEDDRVQGAARRGTPDVARGVAAVPDAPREGALPLTAELEELELDRAMGKLADDDYRRLRAELQRRLASAAPSAGEEVPAVDATRTVRAEPSVRVAPASPAAVSAAPASEAEVPEGAVPAAPAGSEELADRLVRDARAALAQGRPCGTCGPRPEAGARYCSRCGAALGGCPSCGAAVRADGARFCDQCGAALGG